LLESTAPTTDSEIRSSRFDALLVAQDTGGAIRGVIRGDVYWGYGNSAGIVAGKMRHPGRMNFAAAASGGGETWYSRRVLRCPDEPARQAVTADEEALFHSALKDTKADPKARASACRAVKRSPVACPAAALFPRSPATTKQPPPPSAVMRCAFAAWPLEPDGRIDLHGLTQDAAYRSLVRFLSLTKRRDRSWSWSSPAKAGSPRRIASVAGQTRLAKLWLPVSEKPMSRHGGSGAFYVLLRAPKRRGERLK
jgi:hypothetical protein